MSKEYNYTSFGEEFFDSSPSEADVHYELASDYLDIRRLDLAMGEINIAADVQFE